MNGCREIEPLVAALVLGALDAEERERVERHLASCPGCRLTYSRLKPLPALLDQAGCTEATIPSPPPLLEASVLAAVSGTSTRRPRPSRLRWRRGSWPSRPPRGLARHRVRIVAGGLAAALAAVAVAVAVVTRPGSGGPAPIRLAMVQSGLQPGANAVALLRPRPWGTEVDLRAKLAPTRGTQVYEVWFVSSAGRLSAGTFTVGPSGHVTVTLAAGAHPRKYTALGITLEPDGLHPQRRGPNILHARLPE